MTRMMKDSGVEWIGEIPENWDSKKLKYLYSNTNAGEVIDKTYWNTGNEILYTCQRTQMFSNYPDFPDYKRTISGDLLLTRNATPYIFIPEERSIYSNVVQRIHIKKGVNINFLRYSLQCGVNAEMVNGDTIPSWNMQVWNNISIPFPVLQEQQKIAAFLDEKCGAIDEIISKTEQSIEEYKKLKQSVITKAVTKGIRPNHPMQDSNIEWIGEIPQDWSVIKLRYLYQCQNGISKSAEFFGKGFPFVSYKDVYNNAVLPETVSGLCNATEEELNRYSVKQGDIFFTRTSETIEEIGLTSICLNSFENATFAGFLIRCRPYTTKLDFEYSKYYMASSHLRLYFVKEMNLVTRASLSQELLKDLQVLIPPLEEQKEIAQYLDEKCAEIDTLVEKKQQFLAEIANYKKSLIYEYVTGKKEVA